MSQVIKISGDTSGVRKSLLDLSKTIKRDFKNTKLDMFSPEARKFLKHEAVAGAKKLQVKIDSANAAIKRYTKELGKVIKDSEKELILKEKIFRVSQKIVALEKNRNSLQDLAGGGGRGGRAGGFLKKGAMAVALAGGAYAVDKARVSYNAFKEGAPNESLLRGRGAFDIAPRDTQRLTNAGLNSMDLTRQRFESMDVFGSKGSTQEDIIQRAEFERGRGLTGGTLLNAGANLRGVLGGQGADKAVMTLQAALIASGIKDELGPYLEISSSMLTDLNERGFTFDASVMSMFNTLVATNKNMERSGRLISGADQGIRGSTGEANAFFQTAFNKANIGGGSVGGIQAAIRSGGLFGIDLNKTGFGNTTSAKVMKSLGIGSGSTEGAVSKSVTSMLDDMFGSDAEINDMLQDPNKKSAGQEKRMSRLRFVMSNFGLKSEGEALEVDELLKQASTASPDKRKEIEKKIQKIQEGETDLGNLKMINKTLSGQHEVLAAIEKTLEKQLGDKIAPAMLEARSAILQIDKNFLKLLNFMGVEGEESKASFISGKEALTEDQMNTMVGDDPEAKAELSAKLAEAQKADMAEFSDLKTKFGGLSQRDLQWSHPEEAQRLAQLKVAISKRAQTERNTGLGGDGLSPTAKMVNYSLAEEAENKKNTSFGQSVYNSLSGTTNTQAGQTDKLLTRLVKELEKLNMGTTSVVKNTGRLNTLPSGRAQ